MIRLYLHKCTVYHKKILFLTVLQDIDATSSATSSMLRDVTATQMYKTV